MEEISDDELLSSDVDPLEEEAEKSQDLFQLSTYLLKLLLLYQVFDDIFKFRFYFVTVVSYNTHVKTTSSGVYDFYSEYF